MTWTTELDNKAWEQAKAELSPNAPFSNIALLAQEIKKELLDVVNRETSGRVVTGE